MEGSVPRIQPHSTMPLFTGWGKEMLCPSGPFGPQPSLTLPRVILFFAFQAPSSSEKGWHKVSKCMGMLQAKCDEGQATHRALLFRTDFLIHMGTSFVSMETEPIGGRCHSNGDSRWAGSLPCRTRNLILTQLYLINSTWRFSCASVSPATPWHGH